MTPPRTGCAQHPLKDAAEGAEFLARVRAAAVGPRVRLAVRRRPALWFSRRRADRAAAILFAATCVDLAVTNAGLNLTMAVAKLAPPRGTPRPPGPQRVYIGGRVRGFMNSEDPDGTAYWQIPAETTAIEGRMELNAELPMAPSGFRVREALSYDLPYLWPAEYEAAVQQFERAGPNERPPFFAAAACAAVCSRRRSRAVPRGGRRAWLEHARVRVRSGRTRVFVQPGRRLRAIPTI